MRKMKIDDFSPVISKGRPISALPNREVPSYKNQSPLYLPTLNSSVIANKFEPTCPISPIYSKSKNSKNQYVETSILVNNTDINLALIEQVKKLKEENNIKDKIIQSQLNSSTNKHKNEEFTNYKKEMKEMRLLLKLRDIEIEKLKLLLKKINSNEDLENENYALKQELNLLQARYENMHNLKENFNKQQNIIVSMQESNSKMLDDLRKKDERINKVRGMYNECVSAYKKIKTDFLNVKTELENSLEKKKIENTQEVGNKIIIQSNTFTLQIERKEFELIKQSNILKLQIERKEFELIFKKSEYTNKNEKNSIVSVMQITSFEMLPMIVKESIEKGIQATKEADTFLCVEIAKEIVDQTINCKNI
jgi:hypothetical protein